MPMIDLIGPSYELKQRSQSSARLINWQLEKMDPHGDTKSDFMAVPIPGVQLQTTAIIPTDGPCRGQFLAPTGPDGRPRLHAVYGTAIVRYNVDMVGYDVVGKVADNGRMISWTANRFLVVLCDGLNIYTRPMNLADGDLTTFTPISLPEVPGNPGVKITPTHVGALAQRVVCAASNAADQWFFSEFPDAGSPNTLTFSASNFYTAELSADVINALAVVKNTILILGTRSNEIWGTNNNKFDPYSSVAGSASAVGTEAPYSLAVTGDSAYFLGSSETGASKVYKMDGTTLETISDEALHEQLGSIPYASQTSAVGWAYSLGGQTYYVLDFPAVNRTWVWGSDTNTWHERLKRDLTTGTWKSYPYRFGVYNRGRVWLGTNVGPQLCYFDADKGTEWDNSMVLRQRWTPNYSDELNNIQGRELVVDCEVGTTQYLTGQGSDPKLVLQVSTDGSNTLGNFRECSIGKQGQYRQTVRWFGLGTSKQMSFVLSYSDEPRCTLYQGRFTYSVCGRT